MTYFAVWIDGRVYGRILATTAAEASQEARRTWPEQIDNAREYRIERQ
jgi:hypothetical protein